MPRLTLTCANTLLFLLARGTLQAQTQWNNPATDNQWLNAANWAPADVPDTNLEIATFAASDITAINLSAPVTAKRLVFLPGFGDYTFSGSPLTIDVAQAGTATGTAVQTQNAGSVSFSQLVNMSDAGGGNDSSVQILLAAGSTVNLNGGMATVTNRNLAVNGDGIVNLYTSATTGTAQFQHQGNTTLNFFVNPSATNQIRSFSNAGGGVRLHTNINRPLGLGVTGGTSHIGRIFIAANGVTTSGALSSTGATVAGPHSMDVTFGTDIPGTGSATHSGAFNIGALSGTALTAGGTDAIIRLDTGADDTLTMSGVVAGFPTGYTNPVLRKQGPGTAILSGANTYTVPTEVAEGTLILTPAQTGGAALTVNEGTTLGVRLATAGTTLTTTTLATSATITPAVIDLITGTTGNPTAPVISAGAFNPVGPTVIRLTGNLTPAPGVPFPVISYGSLGGLGFSALSLALPFRTTGTLTDDPVNLRIMAEITAANKPVWNGNISGNWDIDSVGDGSTGTANWIAGSGPNTYVQGAPAGTDSVVFDDSATGTTNVNLTTALAPLSITAANNTKDYTFSGTGHFTGGAAIAKTGTGKLTLTNTGTSDNTGNTSITGGTLVIGDGTAGAGSLGGPVTVTAPGILEFNRPDGTAVGSLTGNGGLNLVSGTASVTGGSFSGIISGSGHLRSTATLALTGAVSSTNTGTVTIAAGQLQLNRPGFAPVGGDIIMAGTGQLVIQAPDQIPDTATITLTGSSTDSMTTQPINEVAKDVIVNSSVPGAAGGQIILRNGFTVTGTGTVTRGILGVASGSTATVNAINITSAPGTDGILRIAGSGGPSALNVGAGGITASGGDIQIKFNANNQDAVVNLGGDFTTTGNVTVTNAGYTGASLNIINLIGDRTFTIADGTTTTVAPDIGSAGGLIKAGAGTLTLLPLCEAAHAGVTTVQAGSLLVNGSITVSPVTVNTGGTLGGSGTVLSTIAVESGGTLAPGNADAAALTTGSTVNLAAGSFYAADITGTDINDRIVSSAAVEVNGTVKVTLTGYAPAIGDSFDLINATAITGTPSFDFSAAPLASGQAWDTSTFLSDGIIKVIAGGSAYDTWATDNSLTGPDAAPTADPDKDGTANLLEFATNADPRSATSRARVYERLHTIDGSPALTFTVATRKTAAFTADGSTQTATRDGVKYTVEAGDAPSPWNVAVTELTPADAAAVQAALTLPTLDSSWEWHTFRAAGTPSSDSRRFIRLRVE